MLWNIYHSSLLTLSFWSKPAKRKGTIFSLLPKIMNSCCNRRIHLQKLILMNELNPWWKTTTPPPPTICLICFCWSLPRGSRVPQISLRSLRLRERERERSISEAGMPSRRQNNASSSQSIVFSDIRSHTAVSLTRLNSATTSWNMV